MNLIMGRELEKGFHNINKINKLNSKILVNKNIILNQYILLGNMDVNYFL